MNRDFENKDYRNAFTEEFVRTGMAFQIRALRNREDWSQQQLGERAGTAQNVISRLESPDYGNLTVNTLIRLAAAFDVGLLVRFVSFSDLWRATQKLSPQEIAVPSFEAEKALIQSPPASTAGRVFKARSGTLSGSNRSVGTALSTPIKASRRATSAELAIHG